MPANEYMDRVENHFKSDFVGKYSHAPTILWLIDRNRNLDFSLDVIAMVGMVISAAVVLNGAANMILMTVLWPG